MGVADDALSIEIGADFVGDQAFSALQKSVASVTVNLQPMNAEAKKTADVGEQVKKAFEAIKTGAIGTAVVYAASQLREFHKATMSSVAAIGDQAEQLNLTTTQFQALAYAADTVGVKQEQLSSSLARYRVRIGEALGGNKEAIDTLDKLGVRILDNNGRQRDSATILVEVAQAILRMKDADAQAATAKDVLGLSGSRMIPLLKLIAQGMGEVERTATAAGVMIDEKTVGAANRLENQSKKTELAMRAFYAQVGVAIELKYLQALEFVLGGIANVMKRIREEEEKAPKYRAADQARQDVENLERRAGSLQKQIDTYDPRRGGASLERLQGELDKVKAQLPQAQQASVKLTEAIRPGNRTQDDVNKAALQRLMNDGLPATGGGTSNPKAIATGGGGGDKRDRILEAINQLTGEKAAAEKALATMIAGSALPLKSVEESVALQKKIDDEIAKLGKYDPKDPRVEQIKQLVIDHEKAEAALKNYSAASRDAVEIERRAGDGRVFLREETQRLNEALATGRLSQEAYAAATRVATEKAQDMRLQLIGQQGGFAGLVAGMEYAATQYERNNRAFQVGGRVYEQVVTDMIALTMSWGDSFEQTAARVLQSWIKLLAEMGMREAASGLFNAVGGFSGILSFLGLGGGAPTGGVGGVGEGMLSGIGGTYAAGGRPPVGLPSWVGERGKELFVPDRAGTIYNQDQLSRMGRGGGQLVFNQYLTLQVGEFVTPTQLALAERRMKDATIAGIMQMQDSGDGSMRRAGF